MVIAHRSVDLKGLLGTLLCGSEATGPKLDLARVEVVAGEGAVVAALRRLRDQPFETCAGLLNAVAIQVAQGDDEIWVGRVAEVLRITEQIARPLQWIP